MADEKKPGSLRHRSPNYPAIGLEKAVERAQTLQGQGATKHLIPLTVAFTAWDCKGALGYRTTAALEAYGLVETEGQTDKRQIRLTESARRILLGAPEKPELLRQAALKPSLHAELWKKYEGDLPADGVIKNYLQIDKQFNPNSVDAFIEQFRRTIKYAGLGESDKLDAEDKQDIDDGEQFIPDQFQMPTLDSTKISDSGKRRQTSQPPPQGQLPFPLYLSKTQKAMLYVPAAMTQAEYDELKKQINHSLDVMKIVALAEDQSEDGN